MKEYAFTSCKVMTVSTPLYESEIWIKKNKHDAVKTHNNESFITGLRILCSNSHCKLIFDRHDVSVINCRLLRT